MSTIRFRFTFNQRGASTSTAPAHKAINAAIEGVAFSYAARTYKQVKDEIARRIEKDVNTEISHMAGLMKYHITGIGAGNRAPTGRMNMAHEMAYVSKGLGIEKDLPAGAGVRWEDRTEAYMRNKKRRGFGQTWFKNTGLLQSYLNRRNTWTTAYGPVVVSVFPSKKGTMPTESLGRLSTRSPVRSKGGRITYTSAEFGHNIRNHVATVQVSALGRITPSMLPALGTGAMGAYPDSRKTKLFNALPEPVRKRLEGPKRLQNHRHTVEPFLSFMLTRAVPNALFLRMERGLAMKLQTRAKGSSSL